MRLSVAVLLVSAVFVSGVAHAQSDAPTPLPPGGEAPIAPGGNDALQQPPLVNAPAPESPPATKPTGELAPTPPPPGYVPQGDSKVPYPYSPYGAVKTPEPGPEIGLMITESAFGILAAAGSSILMHFFMIRPLSTQLSQAQPGLGDVLLILTYASVPLAVAQSEVGLANGSRYYYSETWPALLAGLGVEAAVLGLFYLNDGVNGFNSGLGISAGEILLLVGTSVALPLGEMAVINLTKQPRWKSGGAFGSLLRYDEGRGLQAGLPMPLPMPVKTASGVDLGIGMNLAMGRF